jgi:hypothetical protein
MEIALGSVGEYDFFGMLLAQPARKQQETAIKNLSIRHFRSDQIPGQIKNA